MNPNQEESPYVFALPDLFEIADDGAQIKAARCNSCGTFFFPAYHEQHRPDCSRENVEQVLMSKVGKLAGYTTQYYMPPLPFKTEKDITPYSIGLIDFPEGIQIAGIIVGSEESELKIGQSFETTTYRLYQDDEGRDVLTWAFRLVK
ncbi:MAG: OB-fold domain-containing protein [Proteobacteria bacterium]|nr:OB-fold domain-containing protein [Pseudomonadota bacterium]MBU4577123.1 OB-fold domain-containing protein [Pseudomonadota bacterium]MBV1717018.1 OB-fold domain-containing protein [Desulfarculus sp.]